jgi:nitrite reductase/ring-hydroxylating ferredoxin subunit
VTSSIVRWHPTGLAADPPGPTPRTADVGGSAVVLVPWRGRWFAVEDRCSHAGCRFSEDGEIDGDRVICDCHGSEFDVTTGRPLVGPAVDPIATFRVRVTSGTLEVER